MGIDILRVAARNLLRHPAKTLALLLPLALTMAIFSAMIFVQKGLQQDAAMTTRILPDVTVQRSVGGRVERIGLDVAERIEKLEGVRKVVPRVWGYVPVERGRDVLTYTLMGIDLERTEIPGRIALAVEEGRFLERGGEGEAVVGQAFAAANEVQVGEAILLKDTFGNEEKLRIVGIFSSEIAIFSSDLVLVAIDTARRFFNYESGEATDLSVYARSSAAADRIAGRIAGLGTRLRVFTREKLAEQLAGSFSERGGIFQVLWLVLLAACFIVSLTQGVNVGVDLRREIAVLKTLGWSSADIIGTKIFESALVGFGGTLFGMVAGLAYLRLGAPGIKEYFVGWAKIYPDFAVPLAVDGATLGILFLIGMVPLMVSAIIPSWLIGVTETDGALRS